MIFFPFDWKVRSWWKRTLAQCHQWITPVHEALHRYSAFPSVTMDDCLGSYLIQTSPLVPIILSFTSSLITYAYQYSCLFCIPLVFFLPTGIFPIAPNPALIFQFFKKTLTYPNFLCDLLSHFYFLYLKILRRITCAPCPQFLSMLYRSYF